MKVIKAFFILIIVWAICLYMLFGPAVIHKVVETPEIRSLNELHKYSGYTVKKLDSDWFGNWAILKKGREEVVLECSDSVFVKLSINQILGQ